MDIFSEIADDFKFENERLRKELKELKTENERLKNILEQFNNNVCFLDPSKLNEVDLELLKQRALVIGIDLAEEPKE